MEPDKTLKDWFAAFHQELFQFLWKLTGNRQLSEDLLQETFVRSMLKFHLFQPSLGSLKNWLYRMAVNLFKDYCRAQAREKSALESFGRCSPDCYQDHSLPEGLAKTELMKTALNQLSEEKRVLLLLGVKHSLEDVADILEIPVGTVKSRMFYARKELSEILVRLQKEDEQ